MSNVMNETAGSSSVTLVLSHDDEMKNLIEDLQLKLREQARLTLAESQPFWSGVEIFMKWIENTVQITITELLQTLPLIQNWSARIGTEITRVILNVLRTFVNFLKLSFSNPTIWKTAHGIAYSAWEGNQQQGLLAQSYAYGKKMAACLLTIIEQCFVLAIASEKLDLTENEKQKIEEAVKKVLEVSLNTPMI